MAPLWPVHYGTIKIPHLNYTIKVKRFKGNKSFHRVPAAWVGLNDSGGATLYLKPRTSPMVVAHEVTHILQHLCKVRSMDFEEEIEHTAYIMQYVMGAVFGYEWVPSP